jgi:hypothetical protein
VTDGRGIVLGGRLPQSQSSANHNAGPRRGSSAARRIHLILNLAIIFNYNFVQSDENDIEKIRAEEIERGRRPAH